jgi:hypothetical protein
MACFCTVLSSRNQDQGSLKHTLLCCGKKTTGEVSPGIHLLMRYTSLLVHKCVCRFVMQPLGVAHAPPVVTSC